MSHPFLWIVGHASVLRMLARQTLFLIALVLGSGVAVVLSHKADTIFPALGYFMWGMDSMDIVFAFWIVARLGVWDRWQGWWRALLYSMAFAYGRMMFDASQTWWIGEELYFRMPGGDYEDYARPALDVPTLLMYVWMLWPAAAFGALGLGEADELAAPARKFSIASLLGLTTLAAITIVWIRLLTSESAPDTAYRGLAPADMIKDWIGTYLPFLVPPLLGAVVIVYGHSKSFLWACLAYPAAIVVDALATTLVAMITEYFTGSPQGGILGASAWWRWQFIAGRMTTVMLAFSTAALLGVRPSFGRSHQPATSSPSD